VPTCPFRRVCAFFRNEMAYMPGTTGLYRRKYCAGRCADCARHMVYQSAGLRAVPTDLFPYQQNRVASILAKRPSQTSA